MSIINIIKAAPLFYELYDNEIDAIIEKCSVMSLEKGEFIVKDGDTGEDFFIILTGTAVVKKGDVTLAELRKGDLFGEMVLLNQNTRTADIIATTYTDVLVINYQSVFSFYDSQPRMFSLLILNLSRLLTKRLDNSGKTIRDLNHKISELQAQVESKKAS